MIKVICVGVYDFFVLKACCRVNIGWKLNYWLSLWCTSKINSPYKKYNNSCMMYKLIFIIISINSMNKLNKDMLRFIHLIAKSKNSYAWYKTILFVVVYTYFSFWENCLYIHVKQNLNLNYIWKFYLRIPTWN